jgi:putative nucleotidyltransferase with HDIG domain
MELADARALVKDKTDKDITVRHLISVEGVMRALARRLGEDQDRWALAGLFHDLDQDQTGEDPSRHAYLAAEWLREAGVEEPVVNAVLAHAHERYRTDLMARAVVHADAIAAGPLVAALVRPERSAGMKVSSVKKKLKEKAFAPGVNREEVYGAEAVLGLSLEEFVAVAIEGLQQVAPDIGL